MRDRYVKLWLSDDERTALRAAATSQGISQQQLLRTALFHGLTQRGFVSSPQAQLPFDDTRVSKDQLLRMPTLTDRPS